MTLVALIFVFNFPTMTLVHFYLIFGSINGYSLITDFVFLIVRAIISLKANLFASPNSK